MQSSKSSLTRRANGKSSRRNKVMGNRKNLAPQVAEEDVEPLSPAQMRELERRIRDSRDPIRYMLVSEFTRRFILYYNVSDDVYVMNDPSGGTLFKRLKTAQSVKRLLGKGTSIVKYSTERGKLKRLSPYRRR
jgi:hypothetical protein